jgi:hypothetical protein
MQPLGRAAETAALGNGDEGAGRGRRPAPTVIAFDDR